ncbi:MAG: hypothetical protein HYV52_03195 [Parcubacteria group bacterium]|nr:hypothetical protein [Parcubacteria group bacterium]
MKKVKKIVLKTVKQEKKRLSEDEKLLADLSREQILDLADASGRKLGFLLALSPLEDKIKESIMDILELATPAQLDKFSEMLELSYLESGNKELEESFKKEVEQIKTTFDEKEKALEEETLFILEQIENKTLKINV